MRFNAYIGIAWHGIATCSQMEFGNERKASAIWAFSLRLWKHMESLILPCLQCLSCDFGYRVLINLMPLAVI